MLYINYTQNILGFQGILLKKITFTVLRSLIFTEFLIFSLTEVKYFISDMQQQYTDIACAFFKNGTQVIDRYHFIRQMVWAFDKVRKRIQQIYGKKYRLLFKHSKRLLIKRNVKLKDWKKNGQILCFTYLMKCFRRTILRSNSIKLWMPMTVKQQSNLCLTGFHPLKAVILKNISIALKHC